MSIIEKYFYLIILWSFLLVLLWKFLSSFFSESIEMLFLPVASIFFLWYDDVSVNGDKAIARELRYISIKTTGHNPISRLLQYISVKRNLWLLFRDVVVNRHKQHQSYFQPIAKWWVKKQEYDLLLDGCVPEHIMLLTVSKETNIPLHILKDVITMQEYGEIIDSIIRNTNQEHEKWQKRNESIKNTIFKRKHKDIREKNKASRDRASDIIKKYSKEKVNVDNLSIITK